MRRALVLVLVLSLTLGLSATPPDRVSTDDASKGITRPTKKPTPNAGQPRRRAVRKSPPAGPLAVADSYAVVRGGTLTVPAPGVLANDNEPQSKPFTAVLVATTANGTLTLNADGSFTYANNGSAATSDSFTYKANNGTVDTNTATVTIAINNPPPVAVTDAHSTPHDTPLTVAAPGVLTNDTVNGAAITSYGVNGTEQATIGSTTPTTQGGSVSLNANGGFSYIPETGFTGADAFHYVLANGSGSSNAAVNVTVTRPAPVAVSDTYSTAADAPVSIPGPGVLANDTINGGTIVGYGSPSGAEQTNLGGLTGTASGGNVRMFADGSFQYTPAGGFSGNDTFKYLLGNEGSTAFATVTITVQAGNTIDFTVNSPGFFFTFTGVSGENPVLTLQRGRTYRFRVQTSGIHPFEILNAPPGSVTNNNISNGILTFNVPTAANNYDYICSIHGFGNSINTTP